MSWGKTFNCTLTARARSLASLKGNLEALKWLAAENGIIDLETLQSAAREGHLHVLKWAKKKNYFFPKPTMLSSAAISGNLELFKWVSKHGCKVCPRGFTFFLCSENNIEILKYLEQKGNLPDLSAAFAWIKTEDPEIVTWLYERTRSQFLSATWDRTFLLNSALFGNFKNLAWGIEKQISKIDEEVMFAVALSGNLEILKNLLADGGMWDPMMITAAAAYSGNLEMLNFLLAEGCPWSEKVTFFLLRDLFNNSDFWTSVKNLKWAAENGCPLGDHIFSALILKFCPVWMTISWIGKNNYVHSGRLSTGLHNKVMEFSPEYFQFFDWLDKQGCEVGDAMVSAVATRKIEIMEWCLQHGADLTPEVTKYAVADLKILKYLRSRGCPFTEETFEHAVSTEKPEIVKYLLKKKCPWNAKICSRTRLLPTLQFLHEHGCPWDVSVTENLRWSRDWELIMWAVDHGCPWTAELQKTMKEEGGKKVAAWVKAKVKEQSARSWLNPTRKRSIN
jgi:hypothetical protein